MSGRDERRKTPRCLDCGSAYDIVLQYNDGRVAGWIISEQDEKIYGVTVVTSDCFNPDDEPVKITCEGCRHSKPLNKDVIDEATVFFKNKIKMGKYLNWSEFKEIRDR